MDGRKRHSSARSEPPNAARPAKRLRDGEIAARSHDKQRAAIYARGDQPRGTTLRPLRDAIGMVAQMVSRQSRCRMVLRGTARQPGRPR